MKATRRPLWLVLGISLAIIVIILYEIWHPPDPGDLGDMRLSDLCNMVSTDLRDMTLADLRDMASIDLHDIASTEDSSTRAPMLSGMELLRSINEKNTRSVCNAIRTIVETKKTDNLFIEHLLPKLKTGNESIRECAREALNVMPAGVYLLNRAKKADTHGRKEILEYAVALSHPELINIYRDALQRGGFDNKRLTAVGLKHQRLAIRQAVMMLSDLINDSDKQIRLRAIDSLSNLGGVAAVSAIRSRLKIENDEDVRQFAREILEDN